MDSGVVRLDCNGLVYCFRENSGSMVGGTHLALYGPSRLDAHGRITPPNHQHCRPDEQCESQCSTRRCHGPDEIDGISSLHHGTGFTNDSSSATAAATKHGASCARFSNGTTAPTAETATTPNVASLEASRGCHLYGRRVGGLWVDHPIHNADNYKQRQQSSVNKNDASGHVLVVVGDFSIDPTDFARFGPNDGDPSPTFAATKCDKCHGSDKHNGCSTAPRIFSRAKLVSLLAAKLSTLCVSWPRGGLYRYVCVVVLVMAYQ
mmetsp:Transcript_21702/g.60282  ORF Transcript_21702/g.60282 Transcript_21702/m.60282 type:complete len:263 (-) Transcript_21702:1577-2365(-)